MTEQESAIIAPSDYLAELKLDRDSYNLNSTEDLEPLLVTLLKFRPDEVSLIQFLNTAGLRVSDSLAEAFNRLFSKESKRQLLKYVKGFDFPTHLQKITQNKVKYSGLVAIEISEGYASPITEKKMVAILENKQKTQGTQEAQTVRKTQSTQQQVDQKDQNPKQTGNAFSQNRFEKERKSAAREEFRSQTQATQTGDFETAIIRFLETDESRNQDTYSQTAGTAGQSYYQIVFVQLGENLNLHIFPKPYGNIEATRSRRSGADRVNQLRREITWEQLLRLYRHRIPTEFAPPGKGEGHLISVDAFKQFSSEYFTLQDLRIRSRNNTERF